MLNLFLNISCCFHRLIHLSTLIQEDFICSHWWLIQRSSNFQNAETERLQNVKPERHYIYHSIFQRQKSLPTRQCRLYKNYICWVPTKKDLGMEGKLHIWTLATTGMKRVCHQILSLRGEFRHQNPLCRHAANGNCELLG